MGKMTTYKVISLPGDKIIAENLTYQQAEQIRYQYTLDHLQSTALIEKMTPNEQKIRYARVELNAWCIDTNNLSNTQIWALMRSIGYSWSSHYNRWIQNSDKHNLFRLNWRMAIINRNDLKIKSLVDDCEKWLEDNGFNVNAIYENWQSEEFDGIEKYDTVSAIRDIDIENGLIPQGTIGYVSDTSKTAALVKFDEYGKHWVTFNGLNVLHRLVK
jgi:hypothetical protein